MGDENKPPKLSLSNLFSANAIEALGVKNSARIDDGLLLDAKQLLIGQPISEGPISTVYEGSYRSIPVAVKVLRSGKSAIESPEVQSNFIREVAMLSRVQHENIVKIIGVVLTPKLMIITELMKGDTLQKLLWGYRPSSLDMKISMRFALDISRAMEYLHQNGIIHRDLKPNNLLLTEDRKRIILADFGVAREVSDEEMSTEAGTYRWMAPEMFGINEGLEAITKKHYNRKVDVYSFSMVLWELITNRTPFEGRTSIMIAHAAANDKRPSVDNIPEQLATLLQSCWARNPDERPEFEQITNFLQDYISDFCQWTNESQEEGEPSSSQEKGEPSSSQEKGEPSSSQEKGEPSSSTKSEENKDRFTVNPPKQTKKSSTGLMKCFGNFGSCL